jgi:hypothetical protein
MFNAWVLAMATACVYGTRRQNNLTQRGKRDGRLHARIFVLLLHRRQRGRHSQVLLRLLHRHEHGQQLQQLLLVLPLHRCEDGRPMLLDEPLLIIVQAKAAVQSGGLERSTIAGGAHQSRLFDTATNGAIYHHCRRGRRRRQSCTLMEPHHM